MREYYNARAPEYDDWWLGEGLFAQRERPGWEEAVERLCEALAALEPKHTLDVACGTAFLTRHLRGLLTGLDQSPEMLAIARRRLPQASFAQAEALALPFADGAFERVFTSHFYGHLGPVERERFLAEARRVAPELVVVDSAARPEHEPEEWQVRELNDGSRYEVYKRYFTAEGLAAELGGGMVLHSSPWFVAVSSAAAQAAAS
jgi:demethylmenaquinone methyltransferase/2-methoxy-6-polyprenyl-1,4-benzoquinol methylase